MSFPQALISVAFCIHLVISKEASPRRLKVTVTSSSSYSEIQEGGTSNPRYRYEAKVKGTVYYCLADAVGDCPRIAGARWKRKSGKIGQEGQEIREMNGTPHWKTEIGDTIYYCYSENLKLCPAVAGGKWERDNTGEWWYVTIGNTAYYCQGDIRKCPEHDEYKWKKVDETRLTGDIILYDILRKSKSHTNDIWTITKNNNKIICIAEDRKKCHGLGKNHWTVVGREEIEVWPHGPLIDPDRVQGWRKDTGELAIVCLPKHLDQCIDKYGTTMWKPGGLKTDVKDAKWVIKTHGIIIYCFEDNNNRCPNVGGDSKWQKTTDRPKNSKKVWVMKIKEARITCYTENVRDCPQTTKGRRKWKLEKNYEDLLYRKWRTIAMNVKVECEADTVKECPKLRGQSMKWYLIVDYEEINARVWKITINHKTITCHAEEISDCKKIIGVGGKWQEIDRDDVNAYKWIINIKETRFYCKAKNLNKCIKVGDYKWEENEKSNKPKVWFIVVKNAVVICTSKFKKDCPHPPMDAEGDWKPEKDTPKPEQFAKWIVIVHGKPVLCKANDVEECPTLEDQPEKWGKNDKHNEPVVKIWITKNHHNTITCRAVTVTECKKIVQGKWHPTAERNDKPAKWAIIKITTELYCDAKQVDQCPKSGGDDDWEKNPKSDEESDDEKDELPKKGVTVWFIVVDKAKIICTSRYKEDCPYPPMEAEGDWKPEKDTPKPEQIAKWIVIVHGNPVYCKACEVEKCPTLDDQTHKWGKNDKYKEPVVKIWIIKNRHSTITCRAVTVAECKKIVQGKWHPTAERNDKPAKWVIIKITTELYCDAKQVDQCPKSGGDDDWEKNPKSDEESDDEKGELPKKGVSVWFIVVDKAKIICTSKHKKDCPHPPMDAEGDWMLEKDTPKPEQIAMWIVIVHGNPVFCKAYEVEKCPTLDDQPHKWGKNEKYKEAVVKIWIIKNHHSTITCHALTVTECNKIVQGKWHPTTEHNETPAKWAIIKIITELYCDAKQVHQCPKSDRDDWKENPKHDEDSDDGKQIWKTDIHHVTIKCYSKTVSECKKVVQGKWHPATEQNHQSAKWAIIKVITKLYCFARQIHQCPEAKGDKWKENPKYVVVPVWVKTIEHVVIECVSEQVDDCDGLLGAGGKWRPADKDEPSNDVVWIIKAEKVTLYCKAVHSSACPKIHGHPWENQDGEGGDSPDQDKKHVDVGQVVPLSSKGRYAIDISPTVKILCYSYEPEDCPNISGGKWKPVRKSRTIRIVIIDIYIANIYVKKFEEASRVVCVSSNEKECPKFPGTDDWIIMGGSMAGLWQAKHDGVIIYCEANVIGNCKNFLYKWALVANKGKREEKSIQVSNTFQMWRLVVFEATYYCDTKYKDDCPPSKHGEWHKIEFLTTSTYGSPTRWGGQVGKTMYYCRIQNSADCPKIGSKWTKQTYNVETVNNFFSDIRGFKNFCKAGICQFVK